MKIGTFSHGASALGALLLVGSAQAASAENWIQFYGDSQSREVYDRDSVQATGGGHVTVMWKTIYYTPQHPYPNSSIPESQTFIARGQRNDINCQAGTFAILGVWYYDGAGQLLGGSQGRSQDSPIQPNTVAWLLRQRVC
jgi:hypothetical protein